MSEVYGRDHVRPVRNVLTAGSSLRVVQREPQGRATATTCTASSTRRWPASAPARSLGWQPGPAASPMAAPLDARQPRPHRPARAAPAAPTHRAMAKRREPDEELRAEFRQLLSRPSSCRRPPGTRFAVARDRRPGPSRRGCAQATGRAHQGLNEELKLVESDKLANLDRERNVLAARVEADQHALDLLQDTATEVAQRVPALILLPEGGLIDRLIGGARGRPCREPAARRRARPAQPAAPPEGRAGVAWTGRDAGAWRKVTRDIDHLNDAGMSTMAAAAINPKFN